MSDPRLLLTRRLLVQGGAALGAAALLGCDGVAEGLLPLPGTAPPDAAPSGGPAQWTLVGGPADGEHLVIAGLVAQEVNRAGAPVLRVGVRASSGSAYNMRAVATGLASLGLAQSQIMLGSEEAPQAAIASPYGLLRVVALLNEVSATLLVLPGRGVEELEDLVGRRVAVLSPGQTPRATLALLATALGIPVADAGSAQAGAIGVVEMELAEAESALNAGTIDAFFCSATHPSDLVYRVLGRTPARPAPIIISPDRLAAVSSAFAVSTISARLYPATEGGVDVPTVASRNVLFASASAPNERVYALTRALWSGVERLGAFPLLRGLNWARLSEGVDPLTLHPGALAWYQKQGLVDHDAASGVFDHSPVGVIAHDAADPIAARAAEELREARGVSVASTLTDLLIGLASGRVDQGVLSADGLDRLSAMTASELEPVTARNVVVAGKGPGAPLQLVGPAPAPARGRRAPPPAPPRLVSLAGRPVGVCDPVAERALARLGQVLSAAQLPPPVAVTLPVQELAVALKEGRISGFLLLEPPPSAAVAAAIQPRGGGALILLDEAEVAALAVNAWEAAELPGGSYPDQPVVKTVSAPVFWLTADTLSDPRPPDDARPLWELLGAKGVATSAPLYIGAGEADAPAFRVAAAIARSYAVTYGDGPSPKGEAGAPSEVVAIPTGTAEDTVSALLSGAVGLATLPESASLPLPDASGSNAGGDPRDGLRSVAALYTRSLTALVTSPVYLSRVNSVIPSGNLALRVRTTQNAPEIEDLGGLAGHRVSIRLDLKDTPRTNGLTIFNLSRFVSTQWATAILSPEPLPEEAIQLFVRGKIDALFWMTEHPSLVADRLIHTCDGAHLVPITGLDNVLPSVPSAQHTLVDAAPYLNLPTPSLLPTVGIAVTLTATSDCPDVAVRSVLSAIREGVDLLRREVPVLSRLSVGGMEPGPSLPRHPAAERFFHHPGSSSALK